MLYRLLLLISLLASTVSLIPPNQLSQSKRTASYVPFSYENTPDLSFTNDYVPINWYNLFFLFILVVLFIIFLVCLYHQHSLVNYFFKRFSNATIDDTEISENLTIIQETPTMTIMKSIYLTVPQPSYSHH